MPYWRNIVCYMVVDRAREFLPRVCWCLKVLNSRLSFVNTLDCGTWFSSDAHSVSDDLLRWFRQSIVPASWDPLECFELGNPRIPDCQSEYRVFNHQKRRHVDGMWSILTIFTYIMKLHPVCRICPWLGIVVQWTRVDILRFVSVIWRQDIHICPAILDFGGWWSQVGQYQQVLKSFGIAGHNGLVMIYQVQFALSIWRKETYPYQVHP